MLRFSLLEMLLLATLAALALGLVTASQRATHFDTLRGAKLSPDGKTLAAAYDNGAIEIYAITSRNPQLIRTYTPPTKRHRYYYYNASELMAFRNNDELIFATEDNKLLTGSGGDAASLLSWKLRENSFTTLHEFTELPNAISLAPSANLLVIENVQQTTISLFDLSEKRIKGTLPDLGGRSYYAREVHITDDGRYCIDFNHDSLIAYDLKDITTPRKVLNLPAIGRARALSDVGIFYDIRSTYTNQSGVPSIEIVSRPLASPFPETGFLTMGTHGHAEAIAAATSKNGILAISDDQGVSLWNTTTKGEIVATSKEVLEIPSSFFSQWNSLRSYYFGGTLTISDDGKIVSVASSSLGIVIWNTDQPDQPMHIGGSSRFLQGFVYWLGFIAWGVVWGVIRARSTKQQLPPEQVASRPAISPLLAGYAAVYNAFRRFAIWLGCAYLAFLLITYINNPTPSTFDWILFPGLFPFYVAIVTYAIHYVQILWFGNHWRIIRSIRRITNRDGKVSSLSSKATLLEINPQAFAPELLTDLGRMESRLSELVGRAVTLQKPLLVATMPRQQDFSQLFAREMGYHLLLSPMGRTNLAVVCDELATRHWHDHHRLLQASLSGALLLDHKLDQSHPWITIGIQTVWLLDTQALAYQSISRRMLQRMKKEPAVHLRSLIIFPKKEMVAALFQYQTRDGCTSILDILGFAATFTAALLANDTDGSRKATLLLLARNRLPSRAAVDIARALNASLDALEGEWITWMQQQAAVPAPFHAPPEARDVLQQTLLPLVRNRATSVEIKADIVRHLALPGYLEVAEVLIELLVDQRLTFRSDVIESLQNLSGQSIGDDVAAWTAWFQQVRPTSLDALVTVSPPDVVAVVERTTEPAPTTKEDSLPPHYPAAPGLDNSSVALMHQPSAVPGSISTVWVLQFMGGMLSLATLIFIMMNTGPMFYPMFYASAVVGLWAIVNASARNALASQRIAYFQLMGLLSCDIINFMLGLIVIGSMNTKQSRAYVRKQIDIVKGIDVETQNGMIPRKEVTSTSANG